MLIEVANEKDYIQVSRYRVCMLVSKLQYTRSFKHTYMYILEESVLDFTCLYVYRKLLLFSS